MLKIIASADAPPAFEGTSIAKTLSEENPTRKIPTAIIDTTVTQLAVFLNLNTLVILSFTLLSPKADAIGFNKLTLFIERLSKEVE